MIINFFEDIGSLWFDICEGIRTLRQKYDNTVLSMSREFDIGLNIVLLIIGFISLILTLTVNDLFIILLMFGNMDCN